MIRPLTRMTGKCDKPGFDIPYFDYDTWEYLHVGPDSLVIKITSFISKINENIKLLVPEFYI
jgi:hypothetical protein